MAKTIQLTFYIYLTDQAQVTALQAQYPLGVSRGPLPAATEFGAPFIAEGAVVTYPCTRTGWLPPGASGKFPLDRAFFTINDGFFGHLFGRDQKYAWIGQFVYQPAVDEDVILPTGTFPPGALREIAWAQGGENAPFGSTSGPEAQTSYSPAADRDSARTPDGFGIQLRDNNAAITQDWTRFGATPTARGWERFYMRIRLLGVADDQVWRLRWGGGNAGLAIQMNSSGALFLYVVSSLGSLSTLLGSTAPLEVGPWHQIDLVYNNFNGFCSVDIWIDKVRVVNVINQAHGDGSSLHIVDRSNLSGGGSNTLAEIDFDDHVGFILPANTAGSEGLNEYWNDTTKPGADWTHGHRVVHVPPRAFDATHSASWIGDVRTLSQQHGTQQAEDALTSSTSGALCAVTTRADLPLRADGVLGYQGIIVSVLGRRAVGGSPELGYAINGGAAVMTAISWLTTNSWRAVMARPTGLTAPASLTSLLLRFTKAADGNATQIQQLQAQLVLVGTWDQCDVQPAADPDDTPTILSPLRYGIHNGHYPRSPWLRTEVPPDSPVWVKAGTYTGNSLGQDIIAKIPAHFVWVRRTDAAVGAWRWWSSMLTSIWALVGDVRGGANVVEEDPEFVSPGGDTDAESRSLVRVGGAATAVNVNAGTYQYVIVGDPGSRFMLNGTFTHRNTGANVFDNNLADPDFLPEFLFLAAQNPTGGGFVWCKGPGHAAPNGQRIDSSEVSTFGNFATGVFTSRSSIHAANPTQNAYSAWRNRDGADYEGLELDEPVVVQIFSYVGDGAASRTIALPRASGKRPLWALIVGHTAAGYVRDPTHTTNTSSLAAAGSSTVTTGITGGGVDQVNVGSLLNVNGQTFEAFVIMAADATAGNGGWGTNGETLYDPVPAPGGQYPEGYTQDELDDLENPAAEPDSFDDGPDLVDDLADALCVPFTLRACNLALMRIGVADVLQAASDLLTPTSREHTLLVQCYETVLRRVLRDYPWPHATRYAEPVLVGGALSDPVNADWVYSWRQPTGALFIRRIIRPELGRKHDENPPPFRIAEDAVGPLLYTTDDGVQTDSNGDPFIEIEYTVRPACGAKAGGDQAFVSCFAWALAGELAGPLARDRDVITRCERNYVLERNTASTTTAKEKQTEKPGEAPWIQARGTNPDTDPWGR
jgi:hypothetical protein